MMKRCFCASPCLVMMVTMAFFCCCCSAFFNSPSCRKFSHSFAILRSNTNDNDKTSPEQQQQQKRRALELLECLTSPNDPDDPNYDAEKDVRRDELLLANDYYELKLELKDRGLRSNGDKLEMIARLLLHTIDPNMNYNPIGQVTTSLSYVNQTDLDSKKIRRMEEAERPQPATIDDPDLDADDIQTLKRRSLYSKVAKQPVRVITDGLSRREASYSVQRVTDNQSNTAGAKSIQAYVVGGRDVLKSWQSTASVVVFVPNSLGWKHKANRLLADEIAFSNQAIVILPDLELSDTKSWEYTLDRLIATMHFSRNEYRPKTISLAGIEEGATVAARAVCDLWDLASYSLSKLPEIAEIHKAGSFTATPLEDTDNDDDDDDDEKTSKPQSSKVGKIILGYAQRIAVQSSRDEDFYSGITFEDDSIKPDDDSSHDTKVSDSNSDSNGDGDEIDDSQSVSNSHSEVAASHEDDITSHKIEHHIDMPSEEPDGEIPAVVDLASAVESEVMDDNASPVDTGALMRELLKELSDSAAATSKLTEASNSKDKAMSSQETARLEQVRARRRALERDLELDATERVENRNLLSAQSTLRPSELALLAPRALLCLCPVKLDINSVAGRLRPPSAFIFHSTSDDRLLPGTASEPPTSDLREESSALHSLLSSRKTSIEDFCVREYESCSDQFISRPSNLLESKGRQDALFVGSFWLDAYARDAVMDRAGRAGRTKFDATRSFFRVSRQHLQDLSYSGDTIAAFMHEGDSLDNSEDLK